MTPVMDISTVRSMDEAFRKLNMSDTLDLSVARADRSKVVRCGKAEDFRSLMMFSQELCLNSRYLIRGEWGECSVIILSIAISR